MTDQPFPGDPGRYPEASQATTALVLGILAVVLCQILGPFAWSIGSKELAAIDSGLRPPENRGTANAGKILGIVATALLGVGVLVLALLLMGAITMSIWN